METGKYALSPAGGYGEYGGQRREKEYHYHCMGGYRMHESAHAQYLRETGKVFLSDSEGDRGICGEPDHQGTGLCHRLLRGEERQGSGQVQGDRADTSSGGECEGAPDRRESCESGVQSMSDDASGISSHVPCRSYSCPCRWKIYG